MKMLTLVNGASARPSSSGATAGPTVMILPSAGLRMAPRLAGGLRSGSRKNQAHQRVSTSPAQPKGGARNPNSSEAPPKSAINGRPSRLMRMGKDLGNSGLPGS